MIRRAFVIALLTVPIGCARVVVDPEETSGGVGGASVGATATGPATTSSSGTGDASSASATTASSSATTGAGGAPSCPMTDDHLSISVTADFTTYACDGAHAPVSFPALVVASSDQTLKLSRLFTCDPGPPCNPPNPEAALTVEGPGLSLTLLPAGALVNVEAEIASTPSGCAQRVLVTNLPSYAGMTNPITTQPITWLAGADGTVETFPDATFSVDRIPGCGAMNGGKSDNELVFTWNPAGDPITPAVTLSMGSTYVGPFGSETWMIRNLRSYASGDFWDDPHENAYWVMHADLDDGRSGARM